jgi:hypothetical protein
MVEMYIREFEFIELPVIFNNPWLSEICKKENIKAELSYFTSYDQPFLRFSFDLDLQYGNAINLPQRKVILLPYEDEKHININYNIIKFHSLQKTYIARPKKYTCPVKANISTNSSIVLESFSLKNNQQKIVIYS